MDNNVEMALKGSEFKRVLEHCLDTIKKEYSLKKVDIEVLLYLSDCGEYNTPTDIYKYQGINRGHVSQAIDTLIKRGYIEALPDPKDRRIMHYLVTDNAKEVEDKIAELKRDFDKKIFEGIPQKEIDAYRRTTKKIMENLKKM